MICAACGHENADTARFCIDCGVTLAAEVTCSSCGAPSDAAARFCAACGARMGAPDQPATPVPTPALPASFAAGRYQIQRFLGEGGRKRVYLAHDSKLDRDVAIAMIKTEGLDDTGLSRVKREAQAMGRLGDHPHVVTVHDVGEENGQPYIVSQYMAGGDLGAVIEQAEDRQVEAEYLLRIAGQICGALEHAHSRGIIHRDLKPGNIWLTAEGDAKLGDFGLAVAFDQPRVTMERMIVGTVMYLPPEQALGREVDGRSDLYSLGCVLYEALTGRPPFVGDDATAIISQHINTAPVAPSWHTQHCPPDLEALVLRLLAKNPDERPASASEVREVLATIDPKEKSATHSDSNVLDKLAHGVFVGREKELDRLRKAFDGAFSGRGGIVMLVGEPGIGKTRTAQELETYARMRGAVVVWGTCHEAAGAPAYWPWVQVGRMYGSTHNLGDLVPDMEGKSGQLVRIFPELPQIQEVQQAPAESDPETAQFLLFDAYTTFIRAISKTAPLVVTLDDLHWADKPSLLLLRHLGRELSRMRVLVVATFRDTELARTHPLSEALAALNRESGFERVVLRGLSRDEVGAFIRGVANVEPSRALVDRIYEETEGNSFFLSEVVNLLTQEGAFTRDSVSDIAVPDGVREALGMRLDRLSEEANEMLSVAAVAGREFTYETLSLLGDHDNETLLRLIEEALEARVIEEMPRAGRYRFTHALMQETLLSELSTTRRVRIHGQVGDALERRWGGLSEQRATRLARHFVEAAMLSQEHAQKAVKYSRLAAEQAVAQYAWPEATRHYEDCLTLLAGTDSDVDSEADLLLQLGVCARNAGDYRKGWRSLMRAIDLYKASGDARGQAQAALQAQQFTAPPERMAALAWQALEALGDQDPYLEANLGAYLLGARWVAGKVERTEMKRRVIELIDQHGFDDARALVISNDAWVAAGDGRLEDAAGLTREAYEIWARLGQTRQAADRLFMCATMLSLIGRLDETLAAAQEALDYARKHHHSWQEENCAGTIANVSLVRCQFEDFDAMARERAADASFFIPMLLASRRETQGDFDGAIAALPAPEAAGGAYGFLNYIHATRARVLLNAGRSDEAKVEFAKCLDSLQKDPISETEYGIRVHRVTGTVMDEAFMALAEPEFARATLALRSTQGDRKLDIGRGVSRAYGGIALGLGETEIAVECYREGLEWAEGEGCPIEVARCKQGLAEVAALRGDNNEALRLLDEAAATFQQHGAKLYLDRAIAKKLEIQGIDPSEVRTSIDRVAAVVQSTQPDLKAHAAPDGTVTIMFSDIEGSTEMTDRLGDQRWMDVLREHNAIVREQLRAHGGFEVKSEGDGFMVAFQSAGKGLECAAAIQTALAARNASTDEPVKVRVGMHAGDVIKEGDDFFGRNVIMAARVASQANGGEILASGVLKALVAGSNATWGEARTVELKGLSGSHEIWPLAWEG